MPTKCFILAYLIATIRASHYHLPFPGCLYGLSSADTTVSEFIIAYLPVNDYLLTQLGFISERDHPGKIVAVFVKWLYA